jgi:hypothetical protein
MAADRRIGGVGQAELDDRCAPLLQHLVGATRGRKPSTSSARTSSRLQLDGACAAEQP